MHPLLQNKIIAQKERIEEWLRSHEREAASALALYMSADIRDAGFKVAPIDANLYPAGFNNLAPDFYPLAVKHLSAALQKQGIPPGQKLLVISEEHTRNLFYLENIHALCNLLQQAGYAVDVASQFSIEGELYTDGALVLKTASGKTVRLFSPEYAEAHLYEYAALIMNHDSSAGTARWIREAALPILPPWQAGWHSRSKARHFAHYRALVCELAELVQIDPWFLAPLDMAITGIDINSDTDRATVASKAELLLAEIQAKYDEYQIREKPFVFLKSDHGTYGMAMLSFENAGEILEINRKEKNKLFKGKSSVIVKDYLLQEGIPTIAKQENHFAETVVMLADNQFIGSFSRVNEIKDARTSLNSTGMYFKMHRIEETESDASRVALILTRVAGIALAREIGELVAYGQPGKSAPLSCF